MELIDNDSEQQNFIAVVQEIRPAGYTAQKRKHFNYSRVVESKQQLVHEYLERSTDKQQGSVLRWQLGIWNNAGAYHETHQPGRKLLWK